MIEYHVVFDGGSLGNPGPIYGSYRIHLAGSRPGAARRLRFGEGTNNEAEYKTLIAALRDILDRLERRAVDPSMVAVEIRGDSQLVVMQLQGAWKARNRRMRELRDEARELLSRFGAVTLVQQPRRKSVQALGH